MGSDGRELDRGAAVHAVQRAALAMDRRRPGHAAAGAARLPHPRAQAQDLLLDQEEAR